MVQPHLVHNFLHHRSPLRKPPPLIRHFTRPTQPPSIKTNKPQPKRLGHLLVQGNEVPHATEAEKDDDGMTCWTPDVGEGDVESLIWCATEGDDAC